MKKGDHEKSRKGKESSVMNAGNEIVRPNFYQSVADILHNARSKAYRAVNFVMVEAYWNIGRMIVEEEQQGKERAGYGALLIRNLSIRLTHDFGKGFTETNLKYFRQFYLTFPAAESSAIRHALRPELAWDPLPSVFGVRRHDAAFPRCDTSHRSKARSYSHPSNGGNNELAARTCSLAVRAGHLHGDRRHSRQASSLEHAGTAGLFSQCLVRPGCRVWLAVAGLGSFVQSLPLCRYFTVRSRNPPAIYR